MVDGQVWMVKRRSNYGLQINIGIHSYSILSMNGRSITSHIDCMVALKFASNCSAHQNSVDYTVGMNLRWPLAKAICSLPQLYIDVRTSAVYHFLNEVRASSGPAVAS